MRALCKTVGYQFLIFLRLKEALFFIWMFPVLLFAVFGSLWGFGNIEYIPFILTGIMGMVITNEGFYSVGAVVKEYYANGLVRYLGKMPTSILVFFFGYMVSRFISLVIIATLLCGLAFVVFNYGVSLLEYARIVAGAFVGMLVLGSIGLCIAFSGVKRSSTNSIMSIVGYFMLFTSDAFYLVSATNEKVATLGNCLPLNGILEVMRKGGTNWWVPLLYFVVATTVFVLLFRRHEYSR